MNDEQSNGVWGLAEMVAILGRHRFLFLTVVLLGIVASFAAAMLIPRQFSASTVLLPPQQQSAAAGALAQLGALAGLAGSGNKTPDDMYVAFFKTRRIEDAIIQRFGLKARYEAKSQAEARFFLESRINAVADKRTGLITLTVDDVDPEMAAKITNGFVEELAKILSTLAVTDAQQRRVFFDAQVNRTKALLNAAEIAFREAQSKTGLVITDALAESGVRGAVELRSRIAAQEVQLQTLKRFATARNPEAQRVAAELAALRVQLDRLEAGGGSSSTGRGMAAVQAYRDMKVQEAALEALIRQLELAKVDEAKDGPLLQQVDIAIPPEFPSKPSRVLLVIGGSVLSLLLAGFLVAVKVWFTDSADRWSRARNAWLMGAR